MKAEGEVPMRKRVIRFLYSDKSREGSSPYGRGLGILANEGVCLRPQQDVSERSSSATYFSVI